MEVVCQGWLHWSYGFLGVAMISMESDWFDHITWRDKEGLERFRQGSV